MRTKLLSFWIVATVVGLAAPSSDQLLSLVAANTARRHALEYSCVRRYTLRNPRFAKQSSMMVRMSYRPGDGKRFAILERAGSEKLNGIIEKLLASEAASSRPNVGQSYDIGPRNYTARLLGTDLALGRMCYVLELEPRARNRYLIRGKVWVDSTSFGIVRLEGQTAASVSIWIGQPQIGEEFIEVNGVWLPAHTRSVSSNFLLGPSELEIIYTDYQISTKAPAAEPTGSPGL